MSTDLQWHRRGYSLTEVMIAVAVVAVLTGLLYVLISSGRTQFQKGDRQVRMQEVAMNFLSRLRRDIRLSRSVDVSDGALMLNNGTTMVAWMREGQSMIRTQEGKSQETLDFSSGLMPEEELVIDLQLGESNLLTVQVRVQNKENVTSFMQVEQMSVMSEEQGRL